MKRIETSFQVCVNWLKKITMFCRLSHIIVIIQEILNSINVKSFLVKVELLKCCEKRCLIV